MPFCPPSILHGFTQYCPEAQPLASAQKSLYPWDSLLAIRFPDASECRPGLLFTSTLRRDVLQFPRNEQQRPIRRKVSTWTMGVRRRENSRHPSRQIAIRWKKLSNNYQLTLAQLSGLAVSSKPWAEISVSNSRVTGIHPSPARNNPPLPARGLAARSQTTLAAPRSTDPRRYLGAQ
jgi:hypothetical protein